MTTIPVHLLVPGPDPECVLLDGARAPAVLPRLDLELRAGQTVVSALRARLRDEWALDAPVLETHLQPPPGTADEISGLAVLERPVAGWIPPPNMAWGAPPTVLPTHVGPRAATWLAEWTTGARVPALRPHWARAGWHERALGWIDRSLAGSGRRRAGPSEVVRSWTLAAVHRVPLDGGGDAWFKAVFPAFHHEPAVTRELHRIRPAWIPEPIGIEEREGWLLLEPVGGRELGTEATEAEAVAAIGRLVDLGHAAAATPDRLIRLGCPRRPLALLGAAVDAALADAAELEGPEIGTSRRQRVVAWVEETVRWLETAGVPDALVHGDFTVFNLFGTPDGPVLIDWSDAAISHPLVDIGPLVDHPAASLDPQRIYDAWLDALAPHGDVARLRGGLDRALGLSAAYELVSYAAILRAVEPANRYQVSDGFRGFWELLDGHAR